MVQFKPNLEKMGKFQSNPRNLPNPVILHSKFDSSSIHHQATINEQRDIFDFH